MRVSKLSQKSYLCNFTGGTYIQFPDKPKDLEFTWNFISDDVIHIRGDTVNLTVYNKYIFVV